RKSRRSPTQWSQGRPGWQRLPARMNWSWPIRRVFCRNDSWRPRALHLTFASGVAEKGSGVPRRSVNGKECVMNTDSRGIAMTGTDAFAVARYERALEQFQSYVGDPIATIDEAVQASPAFVAGHLLKALVLY